MSRYALSGSPGVSLNSPSNHGPRRVIYSSPQPSKCPSRPSGGTSQPPGPQHPGSGCSIELPHPQSVGNGGFLYLPGGTPTARVLLASQQEKVMSWQSPSSLSLDRGYLVPSSLLHLGPLVKRVLSTPGYSAWPAPSLLVSEVHILDSFDKIT